MSRASDIFGSGAPAWVSGKTYRPGDVLKSPADNYQLYVRTGAAGGGATDPASDGSNYKPFGMRAIKSIQRGVIAVGFTATATITAANTSKAELRCLGSKGTWTAANGSWNGNTSAYVTLTNSTTITATSTGQENANGGVAWELTEFY